MQGNAMLFDPHVAHPHFFHELVDRHALGALEGVDNVKPLGAANFRNYTLIHMAEMVGEDESAGLYTPRSLIRKRKVYTTVERERNYKTHAL
jgi:hypothetical protein